MCVCVCVYIRRYVCTYVVCMCVCTHVCVYVCSGIHSSPFWFGMLCCACCLVICLLEISTTDTSLIKAPTSQFSIYATFGGVSNDTFRFVHLLSILLADHITVTSCYCFISYYSYHFLLVQLQGQLLSVHG